MKLAWSILAIARADVWYGEEDVATITNIGGGYYGDSSFSSTVPSNIDWLFDNDFDTVFAGNPSNHEDKDKHLLVTFNVSFLPLNLGRSSKLTLVGIMNANFNISESIWTKMTVHFLSRMYHFTSLGRLFCIFQI